jgi:hypothetical protein
MKLTEYLFSEYRDLTKRYVTASKSLRALLPRFAKISETSKIPNQKTTKELLQELNKAEEEIEGTLIRLRNIRHRLLELI